MPGDFSNAISNARTLGRNSKGAVVVFSSGNANNSWSGVQFPAKLPGVITVGAINNQGNIWSYSSRGSELELVAPSGDINNFGDVRTTDRMGSNGGSSGDYIDTFGGTSAAAPQVTGVAALMLSVNPTLTETAVRNILNQTATDMGTPGFDNTYGYGRVNAEAAVIAAYRLLQDQAFALLKIFLFLAYLLAPLSLGQVTILVL